MRAVRTNRISSTPYLPKTDNISDNEINEAIGQLRMSKNQLQDLANVIERTLTNPILQRKFEPLLKTAFFEAKKDISQNQFQLLALESRWNSMINEMKEEILHIRLIREAKERGGRDAASKTTSSLPYLNNTASKSSSKSSSLKDSKKGAFTSIITSPPLSNKSQRKRTK